MKQSCIQTIGLPQLVTELEIFNSLSELSRTAIHPQAMPSLIINCARWLYHSGDDAQRQWAEQFINMQLFD